MREQRAQKRETAQRIGAAAIACAGALSLGACYERTIRVEGWDYEKKTVQEPLAPDGPVDDLIFGDRPVNKQNEKPKPRPRPN